MKNNEIELGDEARDTVSGYQGIVISIHEYLNGCRRITICPKLNKDGAFQAERTFDEPQFEIIAKGAWKPPQEPEPVQAKTGGTAKTPPRTGSR